MSPSWRFSRADTEHKDWSVLDSFNDVVEDPNDASGTAILHQFSKSIDHVLLDALKARESTTWGALATASGGRTRGTNSHHIPMHELIKSAQDRATQLGIVEDELFSLRLDGTHRVFGVLEDSVFNVIWFDRKHEICPPAKR
ncbi:MAG: hypothetical protein ABIQ04_03910 [Candidatus Saccharimonadales bacterium]